MQKEKYYVHTVQTPHLFKPHHHFTYTILFNFADLARTLSRGYAIVRAAIFYCISFSPWRPYTPRATSTSLAIWTSLQSTVSTGRNLEPPQVSPSSTFTEGLVEGLNLRTGKGFPTPVIEELALELFGKGQVVDLIIQAVLRSFPLSDHPARSTWVGPVNTACRAGGQYDLASRRRSRNAQRVPGD
jgi:hypothetical protein